MKISPEPGPEEAAAIVAALEALRESGPGEPDDLPRDRWRLAGLLGHAPPRVTKLYRSLWSYPSWEGTG